MSDISQDQSMEDVLASIKRVMARDPAPDLTRPATRRRAERPVADPPALDDEGVLELTEQDRDGLTSSATIEASRAKLRSLKAIEPQPQPEPQGTSVEALVTELMRPLLKDWLDDHLPAIVDAAVEREVRRITRG